MERTNVVVIGGGTGLSVLLRGLKQKPFNLSAIITVGDDGGSSGRLRKDLDMPPPGDIRNVMLALADTEPILEKLFQHRFKHGKGIEGHNVGNLFLAAMTEITGDFKTAIDQMRRVLAVQGNVIPVTNEKVLLQAEMMDGEVIKGESSIPESGKKIKRISLFPKNVHASKEAIEVIGNADLIILGPGSLYTSLIPNLLVSGIKEAIKESRAKKIYICNAMTQRGETDHYTAFDHVSAIFNHTGENLFDTIIVNNGEIPVEILNRYKEEGSYPVKSDKERLENIGFHVIEDDFVLTDDIIRHDAEKISDCLENIIKEKSTLN